MCGICQCERDILLRSQSLKGVLRNARVQCDIVIRDLFLSQRKKWPGKVIFLTFQMNINLHMSRNELLVKKHDF